jgi:GNAT superfamily N-acetyltransferase
MSNWSIREANEANIERLIELRLALQDHMERCNSRIWRLSAQGREGAGEHLSQIFSDENAVIFVAVSDDGEIVGMIIGRIETSDKYVPSTAGTIRLLFVSESWRRRGIGSGLVRRLYQFFASRGIEAISVRYVVGNDEAVQFWTKIGFKPIIITASKRFSDLEQIIAAEDKIKPLEKS